MEFVKEVRRVEEVEYLKGVRYLCEKYGGIARVPSKYVLPLAERAAEKGKQADVDEPPMMLKLPIIDLAKLHSSTPDCRLQVLQTLAEACENYGFFQPRVKQNPSSALGCGTSVNQVVDNVFYWRDFLKLSCHPIHTLLPYWPSSPSDLRQVAKSYAKQSKSLFLVLMEAILESLGVQTTAMLRELDQDGSHLMVLNCYPACPEPDLTLGMPPHSDYGLLTLLLQDDVQGLQVQCKQDWVTVEPVPNSLVVNVGDHLEILSNGRYKSVVHRVLVNSARSRLSVASLHSLPVDGVASPCPELVNESNPRLYKDTDFAAFLDYMSSREAKHKNFLETRKLLTHNKLSKKLGDEDQALKV